MAMLPEASGVVLRRDAACVSATSISKQLRAVTSLTCKYTKNTQFFKKKADFLDWAGKSVLALPNTVGSGRDNTGTIPGTFVDSVTPAAPHASIPRPLGLLPLHQSEQRPSTPARPKSRISKDFLGFFENHDFSLKNESCQIDSEMFLECPGHAYVAGNDSQSL